MSGHVTTFTLPNDGYESQTVLLKFRNVVAIDKYIDRETGELYEINVHLTENLDYEFRGNEAREFFEQYKNWSGGWMKSLKIMTTDEFLGDTK